MRANLVERLRRAAGVFLIADEAADEIEQLRAAAVLVGELAALIPLSETVEATRTAGTMVQWFKDHLK